MQNFTFIGLLILEYLLRFANAQNDASACSRTPEPKLIRSCCKIPQTDEVIRKCRHELLTPKPNESEDMAAMRKDAMSLNMCLAECEFRAKGYLAGTMDVNMRAVELDLTNRYPKYIEYTELLTKGFRKCIKHAREQTLEFGWLNTYGGCNMFPASLLACATEHVYENCPPPRRHNTPACNKMRAFLQKCDELKNKAQQ